MPGISDLSRLVPIILATATLASGASPVLAGPTGGQVTGGDGNIQRPDDQTTNVHQHTDKLVIEWQSFNLTPEEIVNFLQPGSSSIVLNQILDGDMSVIRGQINANGHVILSNANGLYFGSTAQLSVGSLIASGHHLSTEDFLDGNLNFERQEGTSGRVINRGTINAATGGSVTLLGSQVENTGQIVAHAGRINMVVGERIALDFDGDGLMRFAVDEALLSNADGHESAILNQGELQANGGMIAMEGRVAQDIFSQVVNNEGVVRAGRIDNNGGEIRLVGSGGSTSSVVNTGQIDASAQDAQSDGGQITLHAEGSTLLVQGSSEIRADSAAQQGGQVHLLGDRIALTGDTLVDASGWLGGGEILIGGDLQGQNPDIPNAQKVVVTSQVNLHADAIHNGDGGRIIAWADDWTRFSGSLSARGGAEGGDGGFAEVSGKQQLAYSGFADLSTQHGQTGTLLLDPENIFIVEGTGNEDSELTDNDEVLFEDGSGDFEIGADTISAQQADVLLQATQDIIQASDAAIDITEQGIGITLEAGRHIDLQAGITTNGGHIDLQADSADQPGGTDGTGTVTIAGAGLNSNGGDITLSGAELDITQAIEAGAGNVSMTATDNIQLGANVSSTGSQTYSGAVTLTDSVTLTATDSTILFENTVDGAESLTLAAGTGTVTFEGEVGGDTALDSLDITADNIQLQNDVTTDGDQDYNGAVSLSGDRSLTGTTLTFSDTVTGDDNNLTITGDLNLQGAMTDVANLSVSGTSTLSADITTSGTQTYTGTVTLTDSIALTTTDSNIDFGSTIDGAHELTLTAGTGTVTLEGEVGGDTALDSLEITAGSIELEQDVTTAGNQNYNGAVTLTGNRTLEGNTLTFSNTVTGDDSNLTIAGDLDLQDTMTDVSALEVTGSSTLGADVTTTGTQTYNGAVTLAGQRELAGTLLNFGDLLTGDGSNLAVTGNLELHDATSNIGDLTITGNLDLQGAITDVANLEVTGTSTLGADVTTTGSQTYTGSITLTDSVTLTADNSDITLQSSLDGSGNSLGINVGAGNIEFQAINGLQDLEITAAQIELGQDITTSGSQTYNGAVTLTNSITLTTTDSNILFGGSIDGTTADTESLTLTAGTGTVTLEGEVGGDTALDSLEINANSIQLQNDVTTDGDQAYNGTVGLTGTLTLTGSILTFSDTVTGDDSNLTITGDLDLQGALTDVADLEVTGASTLGADITTSGNQTYSGAVTLDDDTIILSSNNGNITFDSDITGNDNSLELDASNGNIEFQAINGLQDLELTAAQIELGQDITTSGSQTYNGAVTLTDSITLTTTDSNILFGGSIDGTTAGDESLTLDAGDGAVTFEGEVGGDIALDSLEITAGSIELEQNVTTTGNQDYNGAVMLTGNRTLEGNTLTFLDTVTGDGSNLAVTGSLELHDATSNIGDLTITGDLNLQGAMTDVADLEVTGASTLGANVTTTGNQTYSGAVSLDDDIITLSSNNGNITFDSDITGNDNSLELDASNGNIEFQAINGLQDLELTANLIQLGQDITTSGNQTYNSAVSLTNSITLTGNTVAFSDTVAGDNNGLTVAGNLDLQGEMTGVAELEVTGSSTLGADVTTTGTQTYNGAVTLAGQRELAGTLLNFGDLLTGDGSNLAVTGNLELHDATSNIGDLTITGDMNLQGTMTDVANLSVSGTSDLGADVTTSGTQTYTGAVTLTDSITLTTTDSNILFENTVDGAESLTLTAGTGTVTFEGEVGADTALDSLEITADNIGLEQDVTTSGNQNYNGAVTLTGNRTLEGNTLTFFNTVTSNDSDLTIAGDLNLQGAMTDVADLEVTGASTLGANVTTTGNQTYSGAVSLDDDIITLSSNNGNITFDNDITGNDNSLELDASNGNIEFQAINGLQDLELTANLIQLGQDITTSGNQTYNSAVSLTNSITLTGNTVAFSDTVAGDNNGLTVAGDLDLQGEMTGVAELEVTGSSTLGADVNTTGNQTYGGTVTLAGQRELAGTLLHFGDLLTGDGSNLTVTGALELHDTTSNIGDLTIAGNLNLQGAITDVTNLEVTGTSTLGADVTTTGNQTYTGAVTLANGGRQLAGTEITFSDTVTGDDSDLTIAGILDLQGNMTAVADLEVTGSSTLGADVTTAGNQTYGGAVTLANGDRQLAGTEITFSDAVAGSGDNLTITGNLDLQGTMTSVADLEVAGTSTLSADVTTTGNQTYTGAITLTDSITLITTDSDIEFGSTIDGAHELTLAAGTGTVTIGGDAGGDTALDSLDITAGSIELEQDVTTSGNQTYNGAVTLTGSRTLEGTLLHFGNLLTGDGSNLAVTGNLELHDATSNIGDLTVNGNLNLQGAITDVANLEVTGASTLGANVTTTGTQTYSGGVTLTDNITLATTNSNIEFGSTIDGAHELTLTVGTGTVTLDGEAGGDTALDSLEITAGNIELDQNITTSGSQTYNGAVTLTDSVVLTTANSDITFQSSLDGNGNSLALNVGGGNIDFDFQSFDGLQDLEITADQIELGEDITTAGEQTYNGAVTLTDSINLTGSSVAFSNTVAGGGNDLTITGDLDLQGDMTNVANLSVSGTSDLGADITTTGNQTYNGAVTLANGHRQLEGSEIIFTDTVDGNGNGLTIDGDLNLQGAMTGVADLQVNGDSTLGANVTTSGNQTYAGEVSLDHNTITVSSSNGNITFDDDITGNGNSLTLNADNGLVKFEEVNDLDNLTIDAGTIEFGNDEISTTGNQSYIGAVNLTNNITLTTANSNITFDGTVDGEYSLTLDTGSGDIDMSDAVVGGGDKLANLTIAEAHDAAFGVINLTGDLTQNNGSGTTTLSGAIEADNIKLEVNRLTLDGISLDTSASDGDITLFVDELLTIGGNTQFNAGDGKVSLATFDTDRTIQIHSNGNCTVSPTHTCYNLGNLLIDAGTIEFGREEHEATITLDGISFNYELRVENNANIIVTGDLDGSAGGALMLNPRDGITRFQGGQVHTQLDQTYMSNVELTGDFVLISDDGNINFEGNITGPSDLTIEHAHNVNLDGTVNIGGDFDLQNATGKLSLVNGLNLTAANIYLNALEIDFENGDPIKLITENNNGDIDLITDNLTIGGELELNAGTGNITLATQSTNSSLGLCSGASCAGTGTYDALYNIGAGFSFNTDANFQVGQAGHTGDITLYGFDADYDLSLANTGNGKITLAGAFSSTHSLTLSSGDGGIDLGANVTTTGNQTYNGAVTLTDSVTLAATDGNITFESTIDSKVNESHALNVNAGAGNVDFQGAVGGTTALASLDVTAADIAFSDISTTGDLTLSSANNLDFATDTELTAGGLLTLAVNQAGNSAGVTLDLNDLILNSNDILLQGGGSDRLQGYEDVSNNWLLSGSTSGRIDNNHLNNGADFTGFSEVLGGDQGDDFEITGTYNGDITGGAGDDEIRRVGNGQINGQIDGGGGTNTYDVSGTNNPVTLTWGQGFTNIQNLIGDGDILRGSANGATDWSLTGTRSGTLGATTDFTGFDRLISGSGGANTFESNGQYNGTIELRGGNNNWHFTPGQRLTRGQVVGNGTLFIAQRDDASAGTIRIRNDDLYLPVLTGFNGNLFIGGKVNPGTLPLDGGFNSIVVNANRLVVDNAVQTGGNLVLLGSEIELTGAPITSGGQVSFVSVGSFCNICGNLTGSGNLRVGQETQVQAQGGQVIAAGGITQADNLVLNFNGGDFELAVSQEQRETSQPNALSNVRGIDLRSSTQAFINRLGLELVSVSVNFANPAASVLGVQAVEVIDLALFEEDLTLFGQLGEGVALAFAQCEEVEGCTPDVTDEELVASIDELQERIDQLEQELVVTSDPVRREQLETLLADFRAQQAEFMAYREDLQAFTGFEELLDEEFDTVEEIDMEAVERELEAIETIYTRVRFLENLQYNSERRAQFSESTGLDLSEDRLNAIIESTLESAARAEARLERLLDGE